MLPFAVMAVSYVISYERAKAESLGLQAKGGLMERAERIILLCIGLLFSSVWLFPLITSLVAGDIVASEDNHGTLKTILTRSTERWQIFAGKLLAALSYAFVALVVFVGIGLVVGGLIWGFDPLTTLSGTRVSAGRGTLLIAGASLAYFVPMMAIAAIAILLSTVTHNSAGAIVGKRRQCVPSSRARVLGFGIDGFAIRRPSAAAHAGGRLLARTRDDHAREIRAHLEGAGFALKSPE